MLLTLATVVGAMADSTTKNIDFHSAKGKATATIVLLHGGLWQSGDKSGEYLFYLQQFCIALLSLAAYFIHTHTYHTPPPQPPPPYPRLYGTVPDLGVKICHELCFCQLPLLAGSSRYIFGRIELNVAHVHFC